MATTSVPAEAGDEESDKTKKESDTFAADTMPAAVAELEKSVQAASGAPAQPEAESRWIRLKKTSTLQVRLAAGW